MSTLHPRHARLLHHDPAPAQAPDPLPVHDRATGRTPVILLLVFVYVLGGTLGNGLGGGGGRDAYVNYIVPGILLMAAATAATGTAVMVATDMTEGIIARFRTMRISRASVLTGHVVGSVIQQLLGMAVLIGIALAHRLSPERHRAGVAGHRRPAHPVRRGHHLAVGRPRPASPRPPRPPATPRCP